MRRLTTAGVAAVAAAGMLVAAPAAGAAGRVRTPGEYFYAQTCPGHVVRNYLFPGGAIRVFYSAAQGGTVCVTTNDESAGEHEMSVELRKQSLSYEGSDEGTYERYAGGIAVANANARCFAVLGKVRFVSPAPHPGTHETGRAVTFCRPGQL